MAPDLPHLFARLSELVHAAGYAPEDLVLIPRSEIDRRETAAFTAGWAEAMSEELPRIRREYEKRVADAYAAGGGRGTDTAARRTAAKGDGATVIRLPFATLLEPSPLVVETEERMRRAQEILDRRSEDVVGGDAAGDARGEVEAAVGAEAAAAVEGVVEAAPEPEEARGSEPLAQPVASRASADARERRTPPASRKVVRRNGRPIVPPLKSVPVQPRPQGTPADYPADGPGTTGEPERRSLAARARALATEMETRGGASRPEVPEKSR
ncbi:hypothetical protein OG625_15600 [Streptomyces sp. NBC_01351]|uniref:hypothetical protein n=1 Tax=Streptomyces sp. NBC_01351 TaxID=2903833 RepID=UPI002E313F48|nr:hypothetical protein [Streptomyces sp. NBC_01351]